MDINRVKQLFLQSKGMKKQVENNLIQNKTTLNNLNNRILTFE